MAYDGDRLFVIILAGGGGTRLWPLSTPAAPKFCFDLTGSGRTLLQATWDRARRLVPAERVVVVTAARLLDQVRSQLPEAATAHLLGEPRPMDSSAAIGLGAALAQSLDPEAIVVTLAADHQVGDEDAFAADLAEAAAVADAGYLGAVGIRPTHPSTAYGYIETGSEPVPGTRGLVARGFVEKPDAARAEEFLAGGRYLWNAGVYAARADLVLDRLEAHTTGWAARLRGLAAELARGADAPGWTDQPRLAFDYSVSEPAAATGGVAAVASDAPWRDLGDWSAVADALPDHAGERLAVLGDPGLVEGDGSGLVVTGGRRVVVLGLEDVVVVDSPNGVLVMPRSRAQEVKKYAG